MYTTVLTINSYVEEHLMGAGWSPKEAHPYL